MWGAKDLYRRDRLAAEETQDGDGLLSFADAVDDESGIKECAGLLFFEDAADAECGSREGEGLFSLPLSDREGA